MTRTFTALFLSALFSVFTAFSADYPAGQYDATVYSGKGGYVAFGQLTLKLGKTDSKRQTAKGTIKVVYSGKKVSGKGVLDASTGVFKGTVGGEAVEIQLRSDENWFEGSIGANDVSGMRNLFLSKDKSEVAAANASIANWKGVVNAFIAQSEFALISLNIGAKGKVKITGTTQNGTKISVTSQVQCGDEEFYVPIIWGKGKEQIANEAVFDKANDNVSFTGTGYGKKPDIPKGATGYFGIYNATDDFGFINSLLPIEWSVPLQISNKLTAPKAAKITIKNYATDESENPCGLKLTLKSKDGSYKGSLYAYSLANGKLKKTKLNVSGVFIGDTGYSFAVVPKKGCFYSGIDIAVLCDGCELVEPLK